MNDDEKQKRKETLAKNRQHKKNIHLEEDVEPTPTLATAQTTDMKDLLKEVKSLSEKLNKKEAEEKLAVQKLAEAKLAEEKLAEAKAIEAPIKIEVVESIP